MSVTQRELKEQRCHRRIVTTKRPPERIVKQLDQWGRRASSTERIGAQFAQKIRDAVHKQEFDHLAARWENDTMVLSDLNRILEHESYLKIVAAGKRYVPFIIEKLLNLPVRWTYALEDITGGEPESDLDMENPEQVRSAWLGFCRDLGYAG